MSKHIDPYEETKTIVKRAFPGDKVAGRVDDIMEFIKASTIVWNPDEESRKLSIAFLHEAKRDIRSCRALYSKRIYSHAVYHLQQAVEKAMKAYCLGLGILSIQEIRGHDTPYILLKGLFEKTGLKTMLEALSEDARDRLDKAWDDIEKPEKRLRIARMSFEEIEINLHKIPDYRLVTKQMGDELSQLAVSIKGTSNPLIHTLSTMATVYVLGSLSFPHEEFTRYPDRQMTPAEYTPKLGIVKAIPKMIGYLNPVVEEMRHRFTQT